MSAPARERGQELWAERDAFACASVLFAAALVLGALGLGNHELWTADEPRVAGIAREMWRTGAWAVPRLSGQPFLEQPPLFYWAQIALFELRGEASTALARVVPAAFSGLALAFTYLLGLRCFSRTAATLGGLVLLTTYSFVQRSHWLVVDSALLCGVAGALACFAHAELEPGARHRPAWLAGLSACLALAFFSKGVIGLGIPALSAFCYLLWRGRLRQAWLPLACTGLPVLALAALWLWQVRVSAGSDGLRDFLVHNQLGRFYPRLMTHGGGHLRPWYYYLACAPQQFMPWFPCALLAVGAAWRHWPRLTPRERAGLQLLLCALLPNLAVLSLAGTKRNLYLLPLAPALALGIGWWMARVLPRTRLERALAGALRAAALVFAVGLVAAPLWFQAAGSARWLAPAAGLALAALALELVPALRRALPWSGALLGVAVGWACALSSLPPLIDAAKNLAPLARELDRRVPPGEPLCALHPSETLRGMMAFYTDRPLCTIERADQLAARVARDGALWLIVEGRSPATATDQLVAARLATREVISVPQDDRVFRLLRVRAGALPDPLQGAPVAMSYRPMRAIRQLLGISPAASDRDSDSVRRIAAELEQLPRDEARYLAAFAYVLARVAHVDLEISAAERGRMAELIAREGALSPAHAELVARLASDQAIRFGGTEDYIATRQFQELATPEQRLALVRCLYHVASAESAISSHEDARIRQIANELRLTHEEVIALRLEFRSELAELRRSE